MYKCDGKGCDKSIFLVRMHLTFLTSNTINISCLVYSNFSAKMIFQLRKHDKQDYY